MHDSYFAADGGIGSKPFYKKELNAALPNTEKCHIRTAEAPSFIISHSFYTLELLAHIIYDKYYKAVPLTRLEKEFKANGVDLSSTTMAN